MRKAVISVAVSMAMVVAPLPGLSASQKTQATRTTTQATGPMAPGGAAGVKQAQDSGLGVPNWWWIPAAGLLGVGVWLLVKDDDDDDNVVTPTPTPTPTTPTTPTTTTGTGTGN